MKLNISSPANGTQKTVEVEDNTKLLPFFERRIGHEVSGDSLGDEFKGFLFRITGGNDKQGFPMMQGVLLNHRARILFRKGMPCFRPRRDGHKKRKSVRGCIVGPDLSVLSLSIVKKGDSDIEGLTDTTRPRRLGPKRANRIRKLFGLNKEDDVRKCVVRRQVKEGSKFWKAPKIQRLLTPQKIARQKRAKALLDARRERSAKAKEDFETMMANWRELQTLRRQQELQAKSKLKKPPTGTTTAAPPAAPAKTAAAPTGASKAKPKAQAKQKTAAKKK